MHGDMDEWFSQRSAKPSTAVRIRLSPQTEEYESVLPFFSIFAFLVFLGI